ncbi:dipeptidase [Pseudopedobacter beijingensis]|uniref:Dipeptidase n=1 Tax=Pseudopedobacter beijingensis TaxID=1207056 RepID=A0ABW4IEU2_9SPHI
MLLIDAHLDLAMNAMEWNRDLKESVSKLRERERGMVDKLDREKGVVSLPDLRKGGIGLVVATQIARYVEKGSNLLGWHSPEQAWAQSQGQLAWYQTMVAVGEMIQITDLESLNNHIDLWQDVSIPPDKKPIGFILSLEGADSLVELSYIEKAYNYGLRVIGPAHYGPGRYAPGTGMEEGFTSLGLALLKEMDSLNMILDVTHLTDKGFWQALDMYKGMVWASHHNCRKLVNHQRQLSDDQIKALIERGGVIGGALDCWMLEENWERAITDPKERNVNLERLVDHFDHICQIAGNTKHIGIGSDLDGMFGKEQSPYDLETISDLQSYQDILKKRGYSKEDIENVFHGNWLRMLRASLAYH